MHFLWGEKIMAASPTPNRLQLAVLRGMQNALKKNPGSLFLLRIVKEYEEELKTIGQGHQLDLETLWHVGM